MRNLVAEQEDLAGCLLTLDALHLVEETCADIRAKDAHFLISVKDNRAKLLEEAMNSLERASPERIAVHEDAPELGHGRIEARSIKVFPFKSGNPAFSTVSSAMLVHRHTIEKLSGRVTDEDELYASSLPSQAKKAVEWLGMIRGHWKVESLHHVKDRTLKEDRCTARGATAVNMSTLRTLAADLLRKTARYAPRASDAFNLKYS